MRSQCVSTCTGREMATQRHSDVWTTFRQVPAVLLAALCIALAPWLLPFCLHSVTWNLSTAPTWEGEGERSRLTFLCFPVNQDYSSYLMMQKQSNMTFEVTILYRGTATPHPPSHPQYPPAPTWIADFHTYMVPKSRQMVRRAKHNQDVIDIDLRD